MVRLIADMAVSAGFQVGFIQPDTGTFGYLKFQQTSVTSSVQRVDPVTGELYYTGIRFNLNETR
jgi:homoaconitase/3-isopropylmalate dehydratase large subunit